jgi:hypothetical protein
MDSQNKSNWTDSTSRKFEYYFAHQEAVESIIYPYDVVNVKDKYDYVFVDEESFNKYQPKSFKELIAGFREYKKQGEMEKRKILKNDEPDA